MFRVGVIWAQSWRLLPAEQGKSCGKLGWLLETVSLEAGSLCFCHGVDVQDEEWRMQGGLCHFLVPLPTPCLICQDVCLCVTLCMCPGISVT